MWNDYGQDRQRPSPRGWKNKNQGGWGKSSKKWDNSEYLSELKFEDVPRPKKPRKYTVSIAVPASILEETCLKDELRTYVVGQIARAAVIYSIDEIVVYDDMCSQKRGTTNAAYVTPNSSNEFLEMMRTLLEYQECPQYLRKHLFQYNAYLRSVGVLNALNSPHHLRFNQWCEYREGLVMEGGGKNLSYVDVGLGVDVSVDQKLKPGLRVTLKMPPETKEMKKPYGVVVSPDEPREKAGYYWGYTVRVAHSLSEVVTGCRFPGGYDLLIGTSDKGENIKQTDLPEYSHAMIVFGGVDGLEVALEADEKLEATEPLQMFDIYANTCPLQQSRTIRTEEAIVITLAVIQDKLVHSGMK